MVPISRAILDEHGTVYIIFKPFISKLKNSYELILLPSISVLVTHIHYSIVTVTSFKNCFAIMTL